MAGWPASPGDSSANANHRVDGLSPASACFTETEDRDVLLRLPPNLSAHKPLLERGGCHDFCVATDAELFETLQALNDLSPRRVDGQGVGGFWLLLAACEVTAFSIAPDMN